jgi:thiamine-phosphate pyrophosphorylase
MQFNFTPASERAVAAAAGWASCADVDELHVPEVLLGLLAEPECRAALMLAQCDVYPEAVFRKFSALTQLDPPNPHRAGRFSAELVACFKAAESRLVDYPRPLFLATEHLLLGIAAGANQVSRWLADCGLSAAALEAEVHRLAGHQPGPLPLDIADGLSEEDEELADAPSHELQSADSTAQDRLAALRVVDAAANRAGEGLRVIEDYLRFALDDRHLTSLSKSIRHELTAALAEVGSADRHAARETQADVGTQVSLPGELVRGGSAQVVAASFKRVEQSLRSLEEFLKILMPESAAMIEQLRYRVYTLERAVDITRTSLARLAEARLYVLIDACSSSDGLRTLVESLVSAGVSAIQLRESRLADRELLARARLIRELTRGNGTLFIVNNRPDLAVLSGADGVHVGQDDMTVKDARRILGPEGLVGVSAHSIEQARAAVLDGASYIGVGPTFQSGTKTFSQFTGPELLRAVHAEVRLPAFAIGGITAENLPQVLATGIERVAVSGAICGAVDPATAARELLAALGR